MSMIDMVAQFFLLFGQQAAYLPIIIGGMIFYKKPIIFWQAFILLFFTMTFSTTLKHIFQVPLNPALGIEGYAFPSGHMQAVVVFYGWLFLMIPHMLVRCIVPLIFIGEGWAMIHCGYHTIDQELAAGLFALITLVSYRQGLSKLSSLKMGWVLVGLTIPLISFLMIWHKVPPHIWMSFYGLGGCLTVYSLLKKDVPLSMSRLSVEKKIVVAIVFFIGAWGTSFLFSRPYFKQFPAFLGQIYWFLLGGFLPGSEVLARLLSPKKKPKRV